MFEYVKLKNFKSFKNVELNFLDRYNKPKKLILIYGENGIGKSNIASSFFMLSETLTTMDVRELMEAFFSEEIEDVKDKEKLTKFLKSRYKDIETIIKENKTVGSTDSMKIEFGFRINNKKGRYILETDDNQIIHEKLEFILSKRKGTYIDITPFKTRINENIFLDKTAFQSVNQAVFKFWGKHSFLSILLHEIQDKSEQFIKNKITDNFKDVITFITSTSCKIKFGSRQERAVINLPREVLGDYESGVMSVSNQEILNKTENMLTSFFKLTNKDIHKAYYKKEIENDRIKYSLVLSKNISGELRDIDFSLESTGTQSIVQQLPFMLVSIAGSVAILDEFDTGIHDLLVKSLVTSLYKNMSGQLILTTHNTLLMESNLPKDSIYVINELPNNDKEIKCILYYNNKLGEKNNIRNQYLIGKYSGVPDNININFDELLKLLK